MDRARQLVDQELLLYAKFQAALAFDLDRKSAERFLKIYLDYNLKRKKIELEREKFRYQCELAGQRRSGAPGAETPSLKQSAELTADERTDDAPSTSERLVA